MTTVLAKNSLPEPVSWSAFPILSCRGFRSKVFDPFGLCPGWEGSSFILLHVDTQFSQQHLLRLIFNFVTVWHLIFVKTQVDGGMWTYVWLLEESLLLANLPRDTYKTIWKLVVQIFLFLSIYLPRNLLPKEDLAYKPTLRADKNKIFFTGRGPWGPNPGWGTAGSRWLVREEEDIFFAMGHGELSLFQGTALNPCT